MARRGNERPGVSTVFLAVTAVALAALSLTGCPHPGLESAGVTTKTETVHLGSGEVAEGVVRVKATPENAGVFNKIATSGRTRGGQSRIRLETWSAKLPGPQETVTSQTIIQAPRQDFDFDGQGVVSGGAFVETNERPPCANCEFEFRYRISNVSGEPIDLQYWANVSHLLTKQEVADARLQATLVPA